MEGPSLTDEHAEQPAVLRFAEGIPGFADAHSFILSDLTEDGVFQLLTCVDDPALSLVVASPWLFFPDYAPELSATDQRVLGIEQPDDAVLFCTVTVPDDTDDLLVNLRAPFVTNARTRAARQVVLEDDLPMRAPVPSGA